MGSEKVDATVCNNIVMYLSGDGVVSIVDDYKYVVIAAITSRLVVKSSHPRWHVSACRHDSDG